MKFEFSDEKALVPSAMVGAPSTYKIVLNETDEPNVITEHERETKNGLGKFKQYSLHLENKEKEKCVANFLFQKQFKQLATTVSKDSKDWEHTYVEIMGVPEEKGDKIYHNLDIKPVGIPTWAEEIVK